MGRKMRAVRPDHKAELWYREQLHHIVNALDNAARAGLSSLAPHWPAVHDASPVDEYIANLSRRFGGIDILSHKLAKAATLRSLGHADARTAAVIHQSVGVDIHSALSDHGKIASELRKYQQWNVSLIQSVPEEYLGKLGAAITEAWEQGRRWESIAGVLDDVGDVTESRIKVIARDQTAKMNSAFARVRMQDVGVTRYEWQTSGDERVRESHAEVDGQVFSFDEPGPVADDVDGSPCHPGESILSRCVALPQFDVDYAEQE